MFDIQIPHEGIRAVAGDNIIKAMRGKNWEKIAELYNGKNWKKTNPDYATNLKKYYEEYNN